MMAGMRIKFYGKDDETFIEWFGAVPLLGFGIGVGFVLLSLGGGGYGEV